MKRNLISILVLLIFSPVLADEVVTLKNGKKALLKDNGTWSYVKPSAKKSSGQYSSISLIDLKLDINSMSGKKIMTSGTGQFFADMFMLKQEMMDMNPLMVNVEGLSRDERKYIMTKCSSGCRVKVQGKVGEVMFQKGIIAEKIMW